jgi:hypothetical protein
MLTHLSEQAVSYPANTIGQGVLQFVLPWERDPIEDVAGYINGQLFLLENYFTWADHPSPETLLESLLHIPIRACRKSIGILQQQGVIPSETMPDVRKATIAHAVHTVYSPQDERLGELYEDIRHYLATYPTIVAAVQSGQITHEEYDQLIFDTVEAVGPKSFELLGRIRSAFLHLAGHSYA